MRLDIVLRYTLTFLVHETEIALGIGVTLVGKLSKYSQRRCVVATLIGLESHMIVSRRGRHASNKQGNGYNPDSNFWVSHTFIIIGVYDNQVKGEGSKGGQIGLISGLPKGVLDDEREQEVYRRQPMRIFQAKAGRRSKLAVVLKW